VARDVYQRVFQREASQKRLVLISRLTVLLLGLLAFILAMTRSRVVFWFVLFAWSGLGASFGPPILFSLYWKRTNKWGIVAGMIVGFATTVVWKLTGLSSRTVYELVPAFFFSALAVVIGSLFTKGKVRPSEV
jgi:SSS family solute:Na+ symporter